ncbi:MAG: pitrilysin family protein [Longimicrobiales bacterium]|nr:pitrilysin family protein [Longimicrobiales bacterium]
MTRRFPGFRGRDPRIAPPSAFSLTEAEAEIRTDLLANGITVSTQRVPGVHSVSTGVWVRQGSAHETPGSSGVSHMLEHMVFKGTPTRGPRELALEIEALGGSLDAFTTREYTAYQARVLDRHLGTALDVLADLTLHPLLRDEDLNLEREVVLEEIAAVEDTPDDVVFDLHAERFWPGHPYGRPILGTRETVAAFTGDALRHIHAERYTGRNLIVAAVGNVAHDEFFAEVEARFGEVEAGARAPQVTPPARTHSGEDHLERDTAQSHLVFAAPTVPYAHPDRYPLIMLSQALGGGMSSRLFQRVREELGLAYAIYAFTSFHGEAGVFGVYAGTRPATSAFAAETVRAELSRIARDGLDPTEFAQVREQIQGQLVLSLESTGARLHRLAGHALRDEPIKSVDEVLDEIRAVSAETIAGVAERFLAPERHYFLSLGPTP